MALTYVSRDYENVDPSEQNLRLTAAVDLRKENRYDRFISYYLNTISTYR